MIEIKHLKKEYKSFSLQCSMDVKQGWITGLVGQNGAGKSTIFKALLGLIPFESGEIRVLGKDIRTLTAKDRQRIGVVLSDSGFSGYLTVKDIVPVLASLYENFEKEAFLAQVKRFELPLDKKIKEFSTGMKAKLKVLVAISHGADLLLLDEPTAGLDVVARDELLLLLREYMGESEERSILISSHISSDLEALCDDLYMIHGGSIILHEDTDVLLDEYAILKVDEEQFAALDKQYIRYIKKEEFGYRCLTAKRQYYMENAPEITVEKGSVDSIMSLIIRGERL